MHGYGHGHGRDRDHDGVRGGANVPPGQRASLFCPGDLHEGPPRGYDRSLQHVRACIDEQFSR